MVKELDEYRHWCWNCFRYGNRHSIIQILIKSNKSNTSIMAEEEKENEVEAAQDAIDEVTEESEDEE